MNVKAKEIAEKIMALPVSDRLWPNCLNKPIKNASMIDVGDFTSKIKKTAPRVDGDVSDATGNKGAAARTRSKSSFKMWRNGFPLILYTYYV